MIILFLICLIIGAWLSGLWLDNRRGKRDKLDREQLSADLLDEAIWLSKYKQEQDEIFAKIDRKRLISPYPKLKPYNTTNQNNEDTKKST